MSAKPSEFEFIRQYFAGLDGASSHGVQLSVGDDCAVIQPPTGCQLCISTDTMVEGVHFPKGAPAYFLAMRVLGAALSDLAAMGATPAFVTLSLTLPVSDENWIREFSRGIREMVTKYDFNLVGGDTTQGPLSVSVQVHGYAHPNDIAKRSDAEAGDLVVVTGNLGDAGAALDYLDDINEIDLGELTNGSDKAVFLKRYYQPVPRFMESAELRQQINACIDISDGLVADARHIAEASGVVLNIDVTRLPKSAALMKLDEADSTRLALSAGDDYELLFTIRPESWELMSAQGFLGSYTVIGHVSEGIPDVVLKHGEQRVFVATEGYQHFE